MTNKDFYAFCRDQRKVEQNPQKREALQDVYNYMRECGVSKKGVSWYVGHRISQEHGNELKIASYQRLLDQFTGKPLVENGRLEGDGILSTMQVLHTTQ